MSVRAAIAAGVGVGICYTLSPLTVIAIAIIVRVAAWAGRDLSHGERRLFITLLAAAVTARLVAVSILFMSADSSRPFEVLFGDELFFKNRSLWMRNIGLGVSVSPADVIYAFEDVGLTSYLNVLAVLQALVGNAPYGIHVLNSACYVAAALLLFRLVRPVFGAVAACSGLAVLLFMPSLFMWSISALKEPAFVLVAAAELVCAVYLARSTDWRRRALWCAGMVIAALVLETLRRGGTIVAVSGIAAGYFAGFVLPRPRWLLASLVAVPLLAIAVLLVPQVQQRALQAMRTGAYYHTGHVVTPGYSYHALPGQYYFYRPSVMEMPARDAIKFVLRSFVAYVTEPVPWRIESRSLLAYLPEHAFWFVLVILAVVGTVHGVRLDPMLTMLLAAHALASAAIVAVSAGNIGTLIRHRGLIVPYLAWLAGLGLYRLCTATLSTSPQVAGGPHAHDHL